MKLPFTFGTNQLLFRLVFPGIVLGVALAPLLLQVVGTTAEEVGALTYLGFVVVFTGWVISLCDMPIYMLYEGRRFWPGPLYRLGIRREQRRMERLGARAARARQQGDGRAYLEASVELSRFPLNADGEPHVAMPSRLGNLIHEYETYPSLKYGLDSVFFFFRIWVSVDEDLREAIDRKQAAVDGALYVSFSLGLASLLLTGYGLAGVPVQQLDGWAPFALAAGCLVAGHLVYRMSLHAHAQYGEFYKALFDQYRDLVQRDEVLAYLVDATGDRGLALGDVKQRNQAVWRYLRWHRVRPTGTPENQNFATIARQRRERAAGPTAAPAQLSTRR